MNLLESLGVVPPIVLAQIISFLVLAVLVWRFLFAPVDAIMRQRQEQIANSLTGAENQRNQAESLRREYEAHLAKIADEAHVRLEQAMKDAEVARQRILDQAHTEVQELQERHRAQLDLERERLRREMRVEMADIAVLAASRALRGNLTPDVHASVNDHIIAELDKMPAQQTM